VDQTTVSRRKEDTIALRDVDPNAHGEVIGLPAEVLEVELELVDLFVTIDELLAGDTVRL
jgi:hypothetical protein